MNPQNDITVHQAFYGEVQRSHGCIVSTINDSSLKSFLTSFTDRPSALPAGVTMEPYYSGSSSSDYYVFTLTFPDASASRAGMVFTHALIVEQKDLSLINNLPKLFEHFVTGIPKEQFSLVPIIVDTSSLAQAESIQIAPAYIQQVVGRLSDSDPPIIFCGSATSFIQTIAALWAGLPSSFRKQLAYTAGFSALNIDRAKTLLYFQKSLAAALNGLSFISDADNELQAINGDIEKYLLQPGTNTTFEEFLNELHVGLAGWGMLRSSVKAFQSYKMLDTLGSPEELKLLIRNIAKISPGPGEGRAIKSRIIGKLGDFITSGKDENIKSLRNLPIESFENGADTVSRYVTSYIDRSFRQGPAFDTALIAGLVVLLDTPLQANWWQAAISTSLLEVMTAKDAVVTSNIWKLLIYSREAQAATLKLIPVGKGHEKTLLANIPHSIDKEIVEPLATAIRDRKWFLLHANLLLTFQQPAKAVITQLALEEHEQPPIFEGTFSIFEKLPDAALLSLAIEHQKIVLIKEYARRSVATPHLLEDLSVSSPVWLSIWDYSLQATHNLHHGVGKVEERIEQVLGLLSGGVNVPESILACMANSKFANISGCIERGNIWKNIPAKYKSAFLEATANGWIKELLNEPVANSVLEPELESYISSDTFMTSFLSFYRADMKAVLALYEHVNSLKDLFLAGYIRNFRASISEMQSASLGNMIASKRFSVSAKEVFEKAKYNNQFRMALSACKPLLNLGLFDRWYYRSLLGETASTDTVYSVLAETAIKLYSQGPEDRDIWKRAGGEASKLHNNQSREENWRYAIRLLQNGGGGKHLSVKSLLKEMLDDFPHNNQLLEIFKSIK